VVLSVLFCLFIAATASVPFYAATVERADGYFLAFVNNASAEFVAAYTTRIQGELGVEFVKSFNINAFRVAHVKLTKEALENRLQDTDHLQWIEENSVVRVGCQTQPSPIWNLQRLSSRELPENVEQPYMYMDQAGRGVTSYIIDTGVLINHEEFDAPGGGSRAVWGFNGIDQDNRDCNGHGTHVAGTVAGTRYGVAKLANIVGVKVLNCGGSGTVASVMAGIEWVTNNHKKPANANMSLGGGNSPTMVASVEASVRAGVCHVVAAGNSNADACNFSPANAPSAISTGATNIEGVGPNEENLDVRVYFSNYGRCTHIYAPGTNVRSAWIPARNSYNAISGTSMASPHVCGRVTLLQSVNPGMTPADLRAEVQRDSTKNIIEMQCTNAACNQSPNMLLHSAC